MGLRVSGNYFGFGSSERPLWCYLTWIKRDEMESTFKGYNKEHFNKMVQKPKGKNEWKNLQVWGKEKGYFGTQWAREKLVQEGVTDMDKGQSMQNFANHGKEFGFYSKYNKASLEDFKLIYVFKRQLTLVSV